MYFVYLSKKIAIPNGTRLHTVAWNPDHGWIACGGESGLMKVLKLEGLSGRAATSANAASSSAGANGAPGSAPSGGAPVAAAAAAAGAGGGGSSLSMNQTLEGHNGAVVCVTWNAAYSKLTTADENGLIIVWMLHKAMWFEEMINNRNRSVVRDMRWSGDGQRICIVYADGAVIVGGVDGNRLWGKELDTPLRAVQWAPDGRSILFTTEAGEVQLYSSSGDHIRRLRLPAVENGGNGSTGSKRSSAGKGGGGGGGKHNDSDDEDEDDTAAAAVTANGGGRGLATVVAMDWYDGAEGLLHPEVPTFCVALSDGRAQLSRGVDDAVPIVLDPGMQRLRHCRWNTNGTVLALCGTTAATTARASAGDGAEGGSGSKEVAVVKFYSPFGRFLTLLKVPGPGVASMAWEGGGLRLALAVDAFIYFANVRPEHRFGFLAAADTLAFAYQQADRRDAAVCFWDFRALERRVRPASDLRMLLAAGEHAALVTGPETDATAMAAIAGAANVAVKTVDSTDAGAACFSRHTITLCSAVGVEMDCRAIEVEPVFGTMTATHVAVADRRYVHVWQYASPAMAAAKTGATETALGVAQALKRSGAAGGSGAGRERVLDPHDTSAVPMSPESFRAALSVNSSAVPNTAAIAAADTASPAWGRAGRLEGPGGGSSRSGSPIAALAAGDGFLVVGLEDGTLLRYVLPHLAFEGSVTGRSRPRKLAVGALGLRVAVVDAGGVASVAEFDREDSHNGGNHVNVDNANNGENLAVGGGKGASNGKAWTEWERKDAWEVLWSEDDPTALCVMEKTRLVVVTNGAAEEPVACSGYPCRFRALEVTVALVDEIMAAPEAPDRDLLKSVETAPLRSLREKAAVSGTVEAYTQLSQQGRGEGSSSSSGRGGGGGRRRLWRVLAEMALEALDLDTAEKAFVLSDAGSGSSSGGSDYRGGGSGGGADTGSAGQEGSAYAGIQLTKRLRLLKDKMKQKAVVAAFFGRVDEAEALYRDMDRRDLALALRQRQNDYFRVVQLVKQGGGGDKELSAAWANIAAHYFDRCRWGKAAQYFEQVREVEKACDCYFRAGDFPRLRDAAAAAPEGSPLLTVLGKLFESAGMTEDAVAAHLKAGDPKAAVDACVVLNHWDRALELAAENDWPQVEGLLAREASRLLAKGDRLQAVELYRRANKPAEAAMLLARLAEDCGKRRADPMRAKKLHVLAALEVERHRKKAMEQVTTALTTRGGKGTTTLASGSRGRDLAASTAATLHTLMAATTVEPGGGGKDSDRQAAAVLDSAWRGAEAYHFYMLAQRQLHAGEADAAMRTAIRCSEYEDILDPAAVYRLVALAAFRCGYFGVCSRAFVKLETLPPQSNQQQQPPEHAMGGAAEAEADADAIQTMALGIFTRHQPQDPEPLPVQYLECLDKGTPYQACVATGQAIGAKARAAMCRRCRHFAIESHLKRTQTCPLCHGLP